MNIKKIISMKPYLFWLLATFGLGLQFVIQMSSGIFLHPLANDFHLTTERVGWLVGSYYYIYVLMQLPAGLLVDRFGARILVSVGCLISALGLLTFSMTNHVWVAMLARLATGFGFSFCFVALVYLISRWFKREQFPLFVGLSESIGVLIVFFAQYSMSNWVVVYGWRHVLYGQSLVTLAFALTFGLLIRDKPSGDQATAHRVIDLETFKSQVKSVITSKPIWLISFAGGFIFSVITIFASLWAPPILEYRVHISALEASHLAEFIWPGICIGLPIYSMIARKSRFSFHVLIISGLALAGFFAHLLFAHVFSRQMIGCEIFTIGFLSSCYIIIFAEAEKFTSLDTKSTAFGLLNTIMMSMPPLFQPIIGKLVDWHVRARGGAFHNPIHYLRSDFNACLQVLILFMLFFVVSILLYKRSIKSESGLVETTT